MLPMLWVTLNSLTAPESDILLAAKMGMRSLPECVPANNEELKF
jgi:hypothetical protein